MTKRLLVAQRQRHRAWMRCAFISFVYGVGLIDSFVIHEARQFSAGRFATSHQAPFTITGRSEPDQQSPSAYIDGYVSQDDHVLLIEALQAAGFTTIETSTLTSDCSLSSHRYTFSKATGMLRLMDEPLEETYRIDSPPRWIPIVRGEENVLVANGWSFLDPDENEPLSAFDIDAANLEGQYTPKWGETTDAMTDDSSLYESLEPMSSLGFSLRPLSRARIEREASLLGDLPKRVLLEGATDPPQRKLTNNGYDLKGSTSQSDLKLGVFCCAIGGLPLFASLDLMPTTASSGWLSFSRPVANNHIVLVEPDSNSLDERIEVLCAKTKCHLGHYFGDGQGYCINASALNFVAAAALDDLNVNVAAPISWRTMEACETQSPSAQLVEKVCLLSVSTETLVFGAGCFWSVEAAFRRLPGVVSTETGYAGGTTTSPTYEDLCEKETQHAEVVKVTFDPTVLKPRILIDCFLALHDPTKVRAMGKHAAGTGQYRSCIFVVNNEMENAARQALDDCQRQLEKDLSTVIRKMDNDLDSWFWRAEERHQRHDEKRESGKSLDTETVSLNEWLRLYGKRKESVWGSSETMAYRQL